MNLFIDETYMVNFNNLDKSIEQSNIIKGIQMAQEKYILELLGTNLYNYLEANYSALTGNYAILNDKYVAPALATYAYFEILPKLAFKTENTGIFKRNTDTAQPIDFKELNFLRENVKNDAEFYGEKIIKYLCANSTLFPEYVSPGSTYDTVLPSRKSFTSSIFTPRNNRYPDKHYPTNNEIY
jgi:hypothetical protein